MKTTNPTTNPGTKMTTTNQLPIDDEMSERIVSEACRLTAKYGPLVASRKAFRFSRLHSRHSERRLFWRAVSDSISDAYAGQALTAETPK